MLRLIVGRVGRDHVPQQACRRAGTGGLAVGACPPRPSRAWGSTVARGEIVGLAGIAGNGQREFLRALAGLEAASGDGEPGRGALSLGNPVAAQRGGIAYMPADRHGEGLLMALSVRENATLSSLPRYASNGWSAAEPRWQR